MEGNQNKAEEVQRQAYEKDTRRKFLRVRVEALYTAPADAMVAPGAVHVGDKIYFPIAAFLEIKSKTIVFWGPKNGLAFFKDQRKGIRGPEVQETREDRDGNFLE